MSEELIDIRDKTFNREDFKELIEIIENFLITQKLSDICTYCTIDNQAILYNKMHILHVRFQLENLFELDTINKSTGFALAISQNQNRLSKAIFEILIRDKQFNAKKMMGRLKRLGFTSWDRKKKKNGEIHYKIYCYKSPNQLRNALEAFAEYLP